VKDVSASMPPPASTPTNVHQLHSVRGNGAAVAGAGVPSPSAASAAALGIGFMSPLATHGQKAHGHGSSSADNTPAHLQHLQPPAASSTALSLVPVRPPAHLSTDASSSFADQPPSSRSSALAAFHTSPARLSSSATAASAAAHSTFAPSAAPSPAAHTGANGLFGLPSPSVAGSPAAAAAASGAGGDSSLNSFHLQALRGLLDDSLHSLRMELRSSVSDLHVEMIKQFYQAQMEQQQQMDTFARRFEEMIVEVKQLRDDYQQLKHIY